MQSLKKKGKRAIWGENEGSYTNGAIWFHHHTKLEYFTWNPHKQPNFCTLATDSVPCIVTTNQLEIALNVATRTSGYTRDPYQKYQTNLASRLGYLGTRNLESRCPQGSMGTVSGQDPGDMLASGKRRPIPTATEKGMVNWKLDPTST